MRALLVILGFLILLTGCEPGGPPPSGIGPQPAPGEAGREVRVSLFRASGLGSDWEPVGRERIAYDQKGKDGYYDIFLADADGGRVVCLTDRNPALPGRHMGAPAWHPEGRYLLFVAEKKKHPGGSLEAIPGFGGYSDLWVMTPDGQKAWPLTDVPNDYDHGVLPAHFSSDGKRIAWSSRVKRPNFLDPKGLFAMWEIKVADFVESPEGPKLANILTFRPGPESFYEVSGFSIDGQRLVICSSVNQPSVWTQQIFTLDARTGRGLVQLTSEGYNEHPVYTPDGRHIVWMSSVGNANHGADWWIMRADGTGKERLTWFNRPGHLHYEKKPRYTGLVSFKRDGSRFVGGMVLDLFTQEGKIVLVDLPKEYWSRPAEAPPRP